jgi:YggT family protein
MIIDLLIGLINIYIVIVIINSLLSFVLPPYHSVRVALERIVSPLLNPIRNVVPPIQMMDFSPMVLVIILVIVQNILVSL